VARGRLRAYGPACRSQDGERAALARLPGGSGDDTIVRAGRRALQPSGGLKLLQGNLGRAVIKVSAVPDDRHVVEAPAACSTPGSAAGGLQGRRARARRGRVVRFQGPRANGMPELHKLTPPLAVLQGKGFKVALVTDGRMSGASGKVPAAIHVSPEALAGGPLAKVRDGDVIRLDAVAGTLQALVRCSRVGGARAGHAWTPTRRRHNAHGLGRELFGGMRRNVLSAEEGACTWLRCWR
jgi:phosphogluconate dehydratase